MLDDLIRMKAKRMRGFDGDDLLGLLGLERRHTAFDNAIPTGLAFIAGAAAGAGLALLLAPKTGREMRRDLSRSASELGGKLSSAANDLTEQVRGALPGGNDVSKEQPARVSANAGTRSHS